MEHPLIEDPNLPTIFYDGIAAAQIFGICVRVVAFEFRKNPLSGLIERVGVFRLIRPIEATEQIRAEYDRALKRKHLRAVN